MNWHRRTRRLLLAVLVLSACASHRGSDPARIVQLVPTASTYVAGTTVRLVVTNSTGRPVFRKVCERTLQRRQDEASWVAAGGQTCRPGEVPGWQRIDPGQSVNLDTPTVPELQRGEYRIVITIQYEGVDGEVEAASAPFRISVTGTDHSRTIVLHDDFGAQGELSDGV